MIIMLIDMINLANYKNACDSIICLYSTIYLFKLAYLIRLYIFPDTNLSAMHNIYIYMYLITSGNAFNCNNTLFFGFMSQHRSMNTISNSINPI